MPATIFMSRSSNEKAMRTKIALFLFSLITATTFAQAPAKQTFEIREVQEEIKVDGSLNESVWKKPPMFTLNYETSPGDNTPPSQKTEFWLAYSNARLYVAVRAYDTNPSQIRARLTDRDKATNDDFVGVALDTFNDERRAF